MNTINDDGINGDEIVAKIQVIRDHRAERKREFCERRLQQFNRDTSCLVDNIDCLKDAISDLRSRLIATQRDYAKLQCAYQAKCEHYGRISNNPCKYCNLRKNGVESSKPVVIRVADDR